MSTIDKLNQLRNDYQRLTSWADKYGKPYSGGGGGIGHVHSAEFGCTIYFQAYNGDTNYHPSSELSKDVQAILGEAAKAHAGTILETARKMLSERIRSAAQAATREAEKIIQLANTDPE